MKKESVIIVGAGAAGLMAAKELTGKYRVTVLEANAELGGRMRSVQTEDSAIIEAGAEFIHGHLPLTLQLLKEAGIKYIPVDGKMYRKENASWKEQTEFIEGWNELLKQMKKLKQDMTMNDFLHQYFGDDKQAEFRRHIKWYTEGFDLADIHKASVQSLYKEWSHEENENFRIPAGYGSLVEFLKEECEKGSCTILTGKTVKQIDWQKRDITVYTKDSNKYYAEKIIITVPLSILQKTISPASVNFTPALDEYVQAAGEIGAGPVIKAVLRFNQSFWQEELGFVFSDEIIPTWWTQLPDKRSILTGWAGGSKAEQLSDLNDDEIIQRAILSLSSIFEKSTEELKRNLNKAYVFNWRKTATALCGYSYPTLKTAAARKILNTPVENTIFFAGEALYEGVSAGTVEAALTSGKETAARLMKS